MVSRQGGGESEVAEVLSFFSFLVFLPVKGYCKPSDGIEISVGPQQAKAVVVILVLEKTLYRSYSAVIHLPHSRAKKLRQRGKTFLAL